MEKTDYACIARCQLPFYQRLLKEMNISSKKKLEITNQLIDLACHHDLFLNSGNTCTQMYDVFSKAVDAEDFFYEEKRRENQTAKQLLPLIKEIIDQSEDPLYTALLAAANGNIIDVALCASFSLKEAVKKAMVQKFAVSFYEEFLERLEIAQSLAVLADNAGEIVIDALSIDYLQQWRNSRNLKNLHVSFIVKGGPMFNDAMGEDALEAGCDLRGDIVESGSSYIGLDMNHVSETALEVLRNSDIILAKGVANHENVYGSESFNERVFDLFRVKCDPLALEFDVKRDSSIFMKHVAY